MITQNELRLKFRQVRRDKGLTLREIEAMIPNISSSCLSNFETGKRELETEHFFSVQAWLGIPIEIAERTDELTTLNRISKTLEADPTLTQLGKTALMDLMHSAYRNVVKA